MGSSNSFPYLGWLLGGKSGFFSGKDDDDVASTGFSVEGSASAVLQRVEGSADLIEDGVKALERFVDKTDMLRRRILHVLIVELFVGKEQCNLI